MDSESDGVLGGYPEDYPAYCPLAKREITEETCFFIHEVLYKWMPERYAPPEIFREKDPEKRIKICEACKCHRDDY